MSMPGVDEKKGEYQIKSSAGSDGIKITFNKTKSSKSPKHTGLKPGVNSGPASKKSSQSSSKSSSQKFLYQKSSSSGSLNSSSTSIPSPKSTSQPGKSSSKEGCVSPFSSFTGNSNDMLKNMLNLASPSPRTDIMKAFDKKFQIPKLSARGKSDDKPTQDDTQSFNAHPRSAPSTPIQSLTPSPTIDFMREGSSGVGQISQQQQKFFSNNQHQNKFVDQQRQNKKLFKSVSTEQLYGDAIERQPSSSDKIRNSGVSDADFQAFLRAQTRMNEPSSVSMHIMQNNQPMSDGGNVFNDDDLMDLNFIGNEI